MRARGSKSGVKMRPQNHHFPQQLSEFRQRLSNFLNGFLLSAMAFLNAFLLSVTDFLNAFLLSIMAF
jgi:hypothetical protein